MTFEYPFGEDGNGDGVLSCEGLGKLEKQYQKISSQVGSLNRGELGSNSIKLHPLGKLVKV